MKRTSLNPTYKILSVAVVALAIFVSVPTTGTTLTLPFGGRIITPFPGCVAPAGIAVRITPPRPYPLMYVPGASRSYLYSPPVAPGQWLLGRAGPYVPCLIPCPAGLCPYPGQPGGVLIDFHGSSLPGAGA